MSLAFWEAAGWSADGNNEFIVQPFPENMTTSGGKDYCLTAGWGWGWGCDEMGVILILSLGRLTVWV